MLKKFHILIVSFLLVSIFVPHIETKAAGKFKDVTQYQEEIDYLSNLGIINGYGNLFKPEEPIKRIQAVQMILRELNVDLADVPDPGLTDMRPGSYGYEEVAKAVEIGFISGKDDGTFDPFGTLTRGQMAKILSAAYQLNGPDYPPSGKSFSDVSRHHWAYQYVNALASADITTGYGDGTFRPNEKISRQHFAVFMVRYLKNPNNAPPDERQIESISMSSLLTDQWVHMGTYVEELNLPKEIEVTYTDGTVEKKKIVWNVDNLDLNTPGEYIIKGVVPGVDHQPEFTLIVKDVEVSVLADILIDAGKSEEELNLPEEVEVVYPDKKTETRGVVWNTDQLDLNTAGEYVLSGKVEGTSSKASVKVVVRSVEIIPLADITVMTGSNLADVSLPEDVKVTYHDGREEVVNVTWDISTLKLNVSGEYILKGDLANSHLTAVIKVLVKSEFPDSLTVSPSTVTVKEGASVQLAAALLPAAVVKNGLSWTSSDPAIATVDEQGKVTGVLEGTAQITVTTENGKTSTSMVTVSNQPNVYINAYGSVTINGLIRGISMNVYNLDTEPFVVEKVEIYEEDNLYTTYTRSQMEAAQIPTEVSPGAAFTMAINYKIGGVWETGSYAKFYIRTNSGKTYQYTDYLKN